MTATRIELRENAKRGGGQPTQWLKTLYTFAVPPEYLADGHESFGRLRIINEDRVTVGNGFGLHYHQEFEIFSYLVRGELKHQDSMDNVEIFRADMDVSLEEIPEAEVLYAPLHRRREAGQMGTSVQSDIAFWATVLSPDRTISRAMPSKEGERKAYLQVVQSSGFNRGAGKGAHVRVEIGGQSIEMREGDGAFVHASPGEELRTTNLGSSTAEVLLFDVDLT